MQGIFLASVGHGHVDLLAAPVAGIPISNTPDVFGVATADIALLLMLRYPEKPSFGRTKFQTDNGEISNSPKIWG
ncbi:hypothetical protein [Sphingobacterium suaedae]|uniref:Uncharacterized protein n=1 Tax=Sphingobacterium suaedae TaxID=1686402 RepID=A0ABW5KBQ2_9SPHI